MGLESYSSVAANNNKPPPNGAPEGMNPGAVNDCIRQVMGDTRAWYESAEWINLGTLSGANTIGAPAYVSATSFSIAGNVSPIFHVNRRVKAAGTTPFTIYGTITAVSYSSPNTTITVQWDSGSLDATLSTVWYGVVSAQNSSLTAAAFGALSNVAVPAEMTKSISGSTETVAWAAAAGAQVIASPANGSSGAFSGRALVGSDVPAATTSARGTVQVGSNLSVTAAGIITASMIPDVIVEDQRSAGTSGGSAVATTWTSRTLNTIARNTIGASLASNQITLPAGSYYMEAEGTRQVSNSGAPCAIERLFNVTDSSVAGGGGLAAGGGCTAQTGSFNNIRCRTFTPSIVTITTNKAFALQYNRNAVTGPNDLGGAANITGLNESYATLKIWKVA